jgi:hypothetical protein
MWKAIISMTAVALLASCDPLPFAVRNDTGARLRVAFAFATMEANCHSETFMNGSSELEPGKHEAFRCPASEIGTLTLQQGSKICRLRRDALAKVGSELDASICFSQYAVPDIVH